MADPEFTLLREAFDAMRSALDDARHELKQIHRCLTDADGCPDGWTVHLPGINNAVRTANKALKQANEVKPWTN